MIRSSDRELVDRVVQDHLRNICERLAELSEDKPGVVTDNLQVHEITAVAPERRKRGKENVFKDNSRDLLNQIS